MGRGALITLVLLAIGIALGYRLSVTEKSQPEPLPSDAAIADQLDVRTQVDLETMPRALKPNTNAAPGGAIDRAIEAPQPTPSSTPTATPTETVPDPEELPAIPATPSGELLYPPPVVREPGHLPINTLKGLKKHRDRYGSRLGWRANKKFEEDYEIGILPRQNPADEPIAFVRAQVPDPRPYGAIRYMLDVNQVRGKKVELSIWVKGQEPVDGMYVGIIANDHNFNDMINARKRFRKTFDWQQVKISAAIPQNAQRVYFTVVLRGRGQAWTKNAVLKVR